MGGREQVQERSRGGHQYPVEDLDWSPDGSMICSSGIRVYQSRDPEVLVWDTETGDVIRQLEGIDVAVKCVAWSPTGDRIATGSQDGSIAVWDAETGELMLRDQNGTRVDSLTWGPSGRVLVSGSADGVVRVLRAPSVRR